MLKERTELLHSLQALQVDKINSASNEVKILKEYTENWFSEMEKERRRTDQEKSEQLDSRLKALETLFSEKVSHLQNENHRALEATNE